MHSLVSAYIDTVRVKDFSPLVSVLLRLVEGECVRVECNKFRYCIKCIVLEKYVTISFVPGFIGQNSSVQNITPL